MLHDKIERDDDLKKVTSGRRRYTTMNWMKRANEAMRL
jgi:hypothetical protein